MADWIELRVHGVSGTPPEDMLASAHVVQVAGDDRTRCFRPADTLGRELPGTEGQLLEAFHWGRWTSGSWMQALWLLLAPFGIVNAAQFMLPAPRSGDDAHVRLSRAAHAVCGGLLRVLAVVMTTLFSVCAAVTVVDLVVWQWLARRALPLDDRALVAIGMVLAAAVVFGLSLLGRSRQGRRYRFRSAGTGDGAADRLPDLHSADFFDGDPDSPALRTLHRAAGIPVLAWSGLCVAAGADPSWSWVRWIPPLVLLAVVVVAALLGDPERTTSHGSAGTLRDRWHPGAPGTAGGKRRRGGAWYTAWGLFGLSAATLGLAVVAVCLAGPSDAGELPRAVSLPGEDLAAAAVGIAGTGAVVLLLIAVLVLSRLAACEDEGIAAFRPFAGGMTGALAASVGFFVGIGYCAGFSVATQGAINRLQPIAVVNAPEVLQRVSFAWGLTALVLVAAGTGLAIWLRRHAAEFRERARAAMSFGGDDDAATAPRLPEIWLSRTGTAMQQARLKNLLPYVFWLFTGLGVVLAVAAAVGYGTRSTWPLTSTSSSPGDPVTSSDVVIGIGQLALLGLGLGLVTLARGAVKAEGARRGLNVLWDVIAFWPRSVHPYVPPPYAQEVVPALVRRICWLLRVDDPLVDSGTGDDGTLGDGAPPVRALLPPLIPDTGRLVLAGHSQGSLISLVALLWLPEEARERVSWLTFGSQLRQQFPRAFPHYVNVPRLQEAATGHRWLSLYRDTDPIAGPVTSWKHSHDGSGDPTSIRLTGSREPERDRIDPRTGRRECGDEWRLLDPTPADVPLQEGPVAALHKHGKYWSGPDWADAVARLVTPSVPDEQGDRKPAEQLAEPGALGIADDPAARQVFTPRPRGQSDGRGAPPLRRKPRR